MGGSCYYFDRKTQFYYLQARYYDARVGRFISLDPIRGDLSNPLSLNRYVYSLNNPVNYVDPTGEVAAAIVVVVTAVGIYLVETAIETTADIALDYTIAKLTEEEFHFWKSAGTNYAFNLVPGIGEGRTAYKVYKIGDASVDIAKGTVKIATKGNYRKLFLEQFPDLPKGWQVHHTLPQKYDDIMKSAGINIHEVQFLKGIDPKIHSKITTEWTNWDKALGRTPTADDVIDFAKTINEKYGKYWFNK